MYCYWKVILLITGLSRFGSSFLSRSNKPKLRNKGGEPSMVSRRRDLRLYVDPWNRTATENPDPTETDDADIIEKYSNWFGLFPPEQKWKSVRFTVYAIVAGYLLADGIQDFMQGVESSKFDI